MRLTQLEYYIGLSQYKTFSATAEAMHISQPALSMAIKELEHELGLSLIIRKRRGGIEFTEDGERILVKVREICNAIEELKHVKDENKIELAGEIAIMTNVAMANRIAMEVLEGLKCEHPNVNFSIGRGSYKEIMQNLKVDRIALGIMQYTNLTKNNYVFDLLQSNMQEFTLRREKLVFLVGKKHPLAGKATAKMSEIMQYPYVTCNGLDEYTLISFRQFGYQHDCLRVYDHDAVFPMLFNSVGICSRMYSDAIRLCRIYGEQLHMLLVEDLEYCAELVCIYRPKEVVSRLEKTVLERFQQNFHQENRE